MANSQSPRKSNSLLSSPVIATVLVIQGMIAVCVGVGLGMAEFGPPRPLIADIASGVLIAVGLVMMALSFWIRRRSWKRNGKQKD